MLRYLKLNVLFLFVVAFCNAQSITLDESKSNYKIKNNEINFLVDSIGNLHYKDLLLSPWSEKLNSNTINGTSLGFKNFPYWLKISINSEIENNKRILSIDYPLIDSLEIVHLSKGELKSMQFSGDHYPFSNREINYNGFAFPLLLEKGENQIYVRLNSSSALKFPMRISDTRSFFESLSKTTVLNGMFYGWLVVMILYNFFLLVTVKEKVYMYMCFLTAANGMMFLSTSGYGMQYFWPDSIYLNENSFIFFAGFVSLFSALLISSYLELKKNHIFLYKYNRIIIILMLLFIVGAFFGDYRTLVKPLMLVILHNTFFFPITTIILYKKGFKNAKLFLLAWTVYLIGTLLALSLGFDLDLPEWMESFDFLQYGAALEVLLFSLSLGDRINTLKNEVVVKEIEKIQLGKKLVEEHNSELEQKVVNRTSELKEANAIKDKFFAIIAHDLRSSVTSFNGLGVIIKSNLRKNNLPRIESISEKMDQASEQLNTFLDNLLNWSFTQLNKVPYFPEDIDLALIVEEEMKLKIPLAELKNIQLTFEKNVSSIVYVDVNAVRLVARNLIENAIKFTENLGEIKVVVSENDSEAVFRVIDNGVGMESDTSRDLFKLKRQNSSDGTSGEKGSGLGLILCKEFTELNKGRIQVESELGKGTIISVMFPKRK